MKLKSVWGFLPAFCLLALPLGAVNTLSISVPSKVEIGTQGTFSVDLSTTDEVQGLVVACDWNSDVASATGELALADFLTLENNAANDAGTADTVVARVEPGFFVLGVVMDSDGMNAEIIAPGDYTLATLTLACGGAEGRTPVAFRDSQYATVEGGPALDNIVVVGGLSVARDEGLGLEDGTFECIPTPARYFIGSAENPTRPFSNQGDARVMLRNVFEAGVEGYVVALCHDPAALKLLSVSVGDDVGDADDGGLAEFIAAQTFDSGGTIGVVLDFDAPFNGQTIGLGESNIAKFRYECNPPATGEPPTTSPLEFCDMVLGMPLKDNVIVVGGLSIGTAEGLVLENGQFTCNPRPPPEFDFEICDDGIDNDGDGLIDEDDPECQLGFACVDTTAPIGGRARVCLTLLTPEDNLPGHAQRDHVQGFSMSIMTCPELSLPDNPTLDITGTILEALGAEFVSVQGANGEVIVGVLVDALPPFDGATIPPAPDAWDVGCLTFNVSEDAQCNAICDIKFVDGLRGRGKVPVKNLIAAENFSLTPATTDCSVRFLGAPVFFRGDCNMSARPGMGNMAVDISDAAAVVSFLFLPGSWKFNPQCLDACDANDDGRIDLADAIAILQYYLQDGRFPPPPGPGLDPETGGSTEPGGDPTEDKLDCDMVQCPQ